MDTKLPAPPADVATEFARICARFDEVRQSVLKAMAAGGRDDAAEAELVQLSREGNALRKRYDFSHASAPSEELISRLSVLIEKLKPED